jgi:hypothetical protein
MKMLGSPPPGIRLLAPTAPSVVEFAVAERCSAARVRYAAACPAAPLPPALRSTGASIATDGSAGNQKQRSFFVLRKTKTRL